MSQLPLSRKLPIATAAWLACCCAAPLSALAQTATTDDSGSTLERVIVTGSSIKRPVSDGALAVQTITAEDMKKAGVTTAAEVMATITASSNNLTDGSSIGTGGYHDQMGFNSANLRGMGTSSTLVLLNGRRMANFASPGDDVGVDLNNIPAAAIERVEILLDGASAIYGTDAIGGVVNFITKKDFRGVQLDAYAGKTREGGAGKRQASISAGAGDLARDGFNVFGVMDFQHTGSLNTSQRKFISELKIPQRLPWLLSGFSNPANIRLESGDQLDYLQSQNFQINGQLLDSRTFNLSAPGCNPPSSLYLPNGVGGSAGCTYDFMRDLELYPKSNKASFLGRAVMDLGGSHQLFAEFSGARSRTWYVGTSNRTEGAEIDMAMIPQLAATGIVDALPDDHYVTLRGRLIDAGGRASELTSTGTRLLVGMNGTIGAWDYDWALNHSVNTVHDRDVRGYYLYDEINAAIADGTVNPLAPLTPSALAYLNSISVNDEVRSARGTMDAFDIKGTRSLAKLGGGDLALALGTEIRREKSTSRISELLASNNILGDDTPGDANNTDNSRKVWAVYAEVLAPITKQLELQFAVRHDHYQNVGGTTNPKLGLRYSVMPELQLRGSIGTGFRAPSLVDLYRNEKVSASSYLPDPLCMAETGGDLATCVDSWETHTFSNSKLKPERSRQGSLGIQWQASKTFAASADWWFINKRDLINTLGDDVILANPTKYASLIHRYADVGDGSYCDDSGSAGEICYLELHKENRGKQKASGIDVVLQAQGLSTPVGRFGVKLSGTLTLQSKEQTGYGDPFVSNLGKFVTDGVVQRWRHRLTVDWEQGPWSLSLTNSYMSSYDDQNSAFDSNTATFVEPNRVKAYSLWDMAGAWEATKNLTLRAGVKNMFNTSPPFSNQAYFFISGYDPSYTDPRGRFMYVSGSYKF